MVCLEGGDEIHDSLVAFVEKEHITFGMIQGIGTVREVTLAFFTLTGKNIGKRNLRHQGNHFPHRNSRYVSEKPYGHFNIALAGKWQYNRAAIWSRASSELPPNHRHLF